MSKPLTKGETVGFRIDLDLDAQLRDEAERAGKSPGQLVADEISARLRGSRRVLTTDFIFRSSQDRREAEA